MPGLTIDIARVGNESLAIAIASWIILLLLREKARSTREHLGVALGLGLLTKAYFLVFIPILILRRRFYSLAVALLIGGWWYWRNFLLTGTWTGEIMDVAATKLGWTAKLAGDRKSALAPGTRRRPVDPYLDRRLELFHPPKLDVSRHSSWFSQSPRLWSF